MQVLKLISAHTYIGNLAHAKFICPLNFPHWPQNGLPFHYFRSYTIAHMQKFPFILANTCFTSPQLATNRRTQAENRFSPVFFSVLGSSIKNVVNKRERGQKLANTFRLILRSKLYIPSTPNIDLILWHTQLIVCTAKC